jgi:hypothetical protein
MKATDLPVIEETNIFKKNLEMPEGWFEQYHPLLERVAAHTPTRGPETMLPNPVSRGLLHRLWSRLARG